uniref:Partial AB-hydrolase lipase domain-containing protein n=1 Tax=Timema bartmani TaxID=61472 RepID=A0A7R9F1Q4_9NEOP|nr:unnamed protein product [Timema bartmani]
MTTLIPGDPPRHRNHSEPDLPILGDPDLVQVELIQKYGYQVETHHVTSPDGYVTTLHRLPPRGRPTRSTPVLLQHGLLGSSADWVLIGPRDGLGYNLADAGYDVWLGNNRGNSYSRKHVNLTTSNKKYWDFRLRRFVTVLLFIYFRARAAGNESRTFSLLVSSPSNNSRSNLAV